MPTETSKHCTPEQQEFIRTYSNERRECLFPAITRTFHGKTRREWILYFREMREKYDAYHLG